MTLNKIDLVHQYYVEEWPIERISGEAGCTPQTVRNRRNTYGLPDRDRGWTEDDDQRAITAMSRLTMGASLIGDMRTMASELQHRTSTILRHCGDGWLRRYAPHVDTMPPGLGGFQISRPAMMVQRLVDAAREPHRQTPRSATFDIHSAEEVTIQSNGCATVGTGLVIGIPHGWIGLMCSRSGLAERHGVTIQDSPGIIDSEYHGEVRVILRNIGDQYKVSVGDRIAHLVIVPCFWGDIVQVPNLDMMDRGPR